MGCYIMQTWEIPAAETMVPCFFRFFMGSALPCLNVRIDAFPFILIIVRAGYEFAARAV
jgi:hypothetical protein